MSHVRLDKHFDNCPHCGCGTCAGARRSYVTLIYECACVCVSVCESVRVFRCVPCILIPDLGHAWFVLPLLLLHLLLLLVVLLLLLLLLMHIFIEPVKGFFVIFYLNSFHFFAYLHSMLNALSHLLNARSSSACTQSLTHSLSTALLLALALLSLSVCAALLQQQLPFSAAAAVAASASGMRGSCRCSRRRQRPCSFLCVRVHVYTFVCACRVTTWLVLVFFVGFSITPNANEDQSAARQKRGAQTEHAHTYTCRECTLEIVACVT